MAGPSSSTTASVFAFLSNEVRLEILESLYEKTVEVGPLASTATYTEIKDDVGVTDSGRFSYHMDKLTNRFVEKNDEGYRLLEPRIEVVRLKRTGLFGASPSHGPVEIDGTCYRCGATPSVVYENYKLSAYCEACAGGITHGTLPDGALVSVAYPPSGVDGGDLATAFHRATARAEKFDQMMGSGFCPHCCADATVELEPCADHRPSDGEVCPSCERSHAALMRLACEGCGHVRITHPLFPLAGNGPVADALAATGADSAWDRVVELLQWPATVEDDGTVGFTAPDGRTFVVDDDLDLTVEDA